jgi:hypothetical protein
MSETAVAYYKVLGPTLDSPSVAEKNKKKEQIIGWYSETVSRMYG